MKRCISNNFPSDLSFSKKLNSLHERNRLLSSLLEKRGTLRVLCAPASYGKSVLAYQYAVETCVLKEILWVDAGLPAFLLALDRSSSFNDSFAAEEGISLLDGKFLVVFDNCPALNEERMKSLLAVTAALVDRGYEVLLTTRDNHWLDLDDPKISTLSARELLLTDAEQRKWDQDSGTIDIRQMMNDEIESVTLASIAGCKDAGVSSQKVYRDILINMQITSELDAIALLMSVVGNGSINDMQQFTSVNVSGMVRDLKLRYPHCGVRSLNPMFNAVALTDENKFMIVSHHMVNLAKSLSSFKDETEFIDRLIGYFLRRRQTLLATRLACGALDAQRRVGYFDEQAAELLLTGEPVTLLELANTIGRKDLLKNRRWINVVYALGSIGEGEQACRLIKAFQRDLQKTCEETTEDKAVLSQSLNARNRSIYEQDVFEYLFRIMYHCDMADAPHMLKVVLDELLEAQDSCLAKETQRPNFTHDIFKLIAETIDVPEAGVEALERFVTSGYSVEQSLIAACVFVRHLLCFHRKRFLDLSNPALVKPLAKRRLKREDLRVLSRLEKIAMQLFSRQIVSMSANIYEQYLFYELRALMEDQAYLLVSDKILHRIDGTRRKLKTQQKYWRTLNSTEKETTLAPQKKREVSQENIPKQLRINTLGRFEIVSYDPNVVISGKVRKQLRLLISLMAINDGREVSRPWVQRIMWPDKPPQNAKQNLYTMWHILSKSITDKDGGCPFFLSYPLSISLNSSLVETDTTLLNDLCTRLRHETLTVAEYEVAIEMAEDLYRGPLLPGEDTSEVVARRKKYQDMLLESLIRSGDYLRQRGETYLALRYFRFAYDNDNAREDICYRLMMTLWKLGRHNEALNEYFVCRRAQIDKFGVEGTSKLRDLYDAILRDMP